MENVTAVIINWNNTEDTLNCVESLGADLNIIIVDNGSDSSELEKLKKGVRRNVHLILNNKNIGFAAGNNQGIRYAVEKINPEFILLLNSDTIASSDFLKPLIRIDDSIGAVQPKILNMENKSIIDSAGHIAYPYGSVKDRGLGKPDSQDFNKREEISGACGAAVLYRVSALKKTGLFDERLFCLFEDVDLSWRMRKKGYKIIYEPASVVYHRRGISGKIGEENKIIRRFYGFRNCLFINIKYFPFLMLILFSPVHIYRFLTALFFKLRYKLREPFFKLLFSATKERHHVSPRGCNICTPAVKHVFGILQIYNDYYPPVFGGIEKHIHTLYEGLKDKFDIKILTAGGSPFTKIENEVVRAGTFGRIQSAPITPMMPFWLKKLESDILHFHLPCPTAIISWFIAKPKGKVILTYHSDIVRQKWAIGIYKPLVEKFLSKADRIIATSPDYTKSSPILRKYKCVVIPLGIDTSRFYNRPPEEPTVLFVGKLRYYKGLEYLIKAMENVKAKLLIIGTGKEEKRLKKIAGPDKVFFLGNVSEDKLPDYYASCSVFVLPSTEKSEAFGVVQLEAMASSKPVISTSIKTGVPWVNINGVTGLIVPPKDTAALRDAINKVLDNPPLAEKLGRNGRARVEKEFSREKMLKSIEKLYNSCS